MNFALDLPVRVVFGAGRRDEPMAEHARPRDAAAAVLHARRRGTPASATRHVSSCRVADDSRRRPCRNGARRGRLAP